MTVMSDADASVVIFLAKNLSQWLNWLQLLSRPRQDYTHNVVISDCVSVH